MPPAVRRASLVDAKEALAAQSEVLLSWAADADLQQPSAVPAWTVRDVLAHLTVALEALAAAAGDHRKPVSLSDYLGGYADAGQEVLAQTSRFVGDPRARLATAAAAIVGKAEWAPTVVMFEDPIAVADAVATRVLELVVHGLDLGVEPDRDALGLTCRLLAGVLSTRHPGRAVELRVPPYAAVQVLEGTVHRRGTPTAVVSCDPLPWVRVATGRLSWDEAVAAGFMTARGERSDLSPYVPLLT